MKYSSQLFERRKINSISPLLLWLYLLFLIEQSALLSCLEWLCHLLQLQFVSACVATLDLWFQYKSKRFWQRSFTSPGLAYTVLLHKAMGISNATAVWTTLNTWNGTPGNTDQSLIGYVMAVTAYLWIKDNIQHVIPLAIVKLLKVSSLPLSGGNLEVADFRGYLFTLYWTLLWVKQ